MANIDETLGQTITEEIESHEDEISKHGGVGISFEDITASIDKDNEDVASKDIKKGDHGDQNLSRENNLQTKGSELDSSILKGSVKTEISDTGLIKGVDLLGTDERDLDIVQDESLESYSVEDDKKELSSVSIEDNSIRFFLEDILGDDLTLSALYDNGEVNITDNGEIIYTPLDGFSGEVDITVEAEDTNGNKISQDITINIGEDIDNSIVKVGSPVNITLEGVDGTLNLIAEDTIPDEIGESTIDESTIDEIPESTVEAVDENTVPEQTTAKTDEQTSDEQTIPRVDESTVEGSAENTIAENTVDIRPENTTDESTVDGVDESTVDGVDEDTIPENTTSMSPEETIGENTVSQIPEDTIEAVLEDTIDEDTTAQTPEDTVAEETINEIAESTMPLVDEQTVDEQTVDASPEETIAESTIDVVPERTVDAVDEDTVPENTTAEVDEVTNDEQTVDGIPEDTVDGMDEQTIAESTVDGQPENSVDESTIDTIPESTIDEIAEGTTPENTIDGVPEDTIGENTISEIPEDTAAQIPEDTIVEDTTAEVDEVTTDEQTIDSVPESTTAEVPEQTVDEQTIDEIIGGAQEDTMAEQTIPESSEEIVDTEALDELGITISDDGNYYRVEGQKQVEQEFIKEETHITQIEPILKEGMVEQEVEILGEAYIDDGAVIDKKSTVNFDFKEPTSNIEIDFNNFDRGTAKIMFYDEEGNKVGKTINQSHTNSTKGYSVPEDAVGVSIKNNTRSDEFEIESISYRAESTFETTMVEGMVVDVEAMEENGYFYSDLEEIAVDGDPIKGIGNVGEGNVKGFNPEDSESQTISLGSEYANREVTVNIDIDVKGSWDYNGSNVLGSTNDIFTVSSNGIPLETYNYSSSKNYNKTEFDNSEHSYEYKVFLDDNGEVTLDFMVASTAKSEIVDIDSIKVTHEGVKGWFYEESVEVTYTDVVLVDNLVEVDESELPTIVIETPEETIDGYENYADIPEQTIDENTLEGIPEDTTDLVAENTIPEEIITPYGDEVTIDEQTVDTVPEDTINGIDEQTIDEQTIEGADEQTVPSVVNIPASPEQTVEEVAESTIDEQTNDAISEQTVDENTIDATDEQTIGSVDEQTVAQEIISPYIGENTIDETTIDAVPEDTINGIDESTISEQTVDESDERTVDERTIDEVPEQTVDAVPEETVDEEVIVPYGNEQTVDEQTVDAIAEQTIEGIAENTIDEETIDGVDEQTVPMVINNPEQPESTIDAQPENTIDESTIDEIPESTLDEQTIDAIDEQTSDIVPEQTVPEEVLVPAEGENTVDESTVDETAEQTIDAVAENTIDEQTVQEINELEFNFDNTEELKEEVVLDDLMADSNGIDLSSISKGDDEVNTLDTPIEDINSGINNVSSTEGVEEIQRMINNNDSGDTI